MPKRLLLVIAGSFLLAYLAPFSAGSASLAGAALLAIVLMLACTFQRALSRRDKLVEGIALELNKLRRIYHLGKNLGDEVRHRQWFTDLHGFLYAYLTAFDKKSFSQYQETNGQFRKLSYHLYKIQNLETEKDRALYRDLLEAAGAVAGARQRIQELWNGGLPARLWNGLILMAAFSGAAVLMASGPSDRLMAALVLSVLGGIVIVAREADNLSALAGDGLSKRYVENIARLELARHE